MADAVTAGTIALPPRRATAPIAASRPEPVVTPRLIAAFVALSVGMFMAILDIQIVASSLAEIQAGLSASASEIAWVQTSYLIAEIVMIPVVFSAAFTVFPKNRQSMIAAIVGLIATLAPTVGPTIGGLLTNTFS